MKNVNLSTLLGEGSQSSPRKVPPRREEPQTQRLSPPELAGSVQRGERRWWAPHREPARPWPRTVLGATRGMGTLPRGGHSRREAAGCLGGSPGLLSRGGSPASRPKGQHLCRKPPRGGPSHGSSRGGCTEGPQARTKGSPRAHPEVPSPGRVRGCSSPHQGLEIPVAQWSAVLSTTARGYPTARRSCSPTSFTPVITSTPYLRPTGRAPDTEHMVSCTVFTPYIIQHTDRINISCTCTS